MLQKYFHLSFCNFLRTNPILTSTTFFPYKCRIAGVDDDNDGDDEEGDDLDDGEEE